MRIIDWSSDVCSSDRGRACDHRTATGGSDAMKLAQHGIALITAIFIVALAAIAAAAILSSANLAIHRTQNLQESELAWWYVDGVESWVKTILLRDAEINKYDSLGDIWAMPVD